VRPPRHAQAPFTQLWVPAAQAIPQPPQWFASFVSQNRGMPSREATSPPTQAQVAATQLIAAGQA
jgi:hypothetical protein